MRFVSIVSLVSLAIPMMVLSLIAAPVYVIKADGYDRMRLFGTTSYTLANGKMVQLSGWFTHIIINDGPKPAQIKSVSYKSYKQLPVCREQTPRSLGLPKVIDPYSVEVTELHINYFGPKDRPPEGVWARRQCDAIRIWLTW